jgi:hypothetical protein
MTTRYPHGSSPLIPTPEQPSDEPNPSQSQNNTPSDAPSSDFSDHTIRPSYDRNPSSYHTAKLSISDTQEFSVPAMTAFHSHAPSIGLRYHDGISTPIEEDPPALTISVPKKASPHKKLSSFFGWKITRSPSMDSHSTTFSEESLSPSASPHPGFAPPARSIPAPLDVPRANASVQHSHYLPPGTPLMLPLPTPPTSTSQAAELEQELRELSSELAQSIKREMELEDEVDRLRAEKLPPAGLDADRRTSDYYSDSGAGSVRYPLGDGEGRIEELESMRRKAEQQKAQMKADMSQRLEEALRQRRLLETRLQELEEFVRMPSGADGVRVRELEAALDEVRRKVQEERQFRESYESLIAGMRLEMEQYRNERDNLRDEVVPQLHAKLEGLENAAADVQSLTYENSRMQQEVDSLKVELQSTQNHRIRSITEEEFSPHPVLSPTLANGLSRSMSLASKRPGIGSRSRSNSVLARSGSVRDPGVSRSGTVKEHSNSNEPREVLLQKLKELEEQRDALHGAVKNLILRHHLMEKQHAKKVKAMEKERDNAMNVSPRRSAFHEEVRTLRDEITHLRHRADDALNQKWQCEKGLGGLKMDLDRAQQETSSLRKLLQERDIFTPERPGSSSSQQQHQSDVSLDKAYSELNTTHALAIASIRELEASNSHSTSAHKTLELLRQSISDAEAERDIAMRQAESYREEARKLQKSELDHLSKEQSLASDLYASAQRMDELANQVQIQIQANSQLRQRLAEAISRGEKEQETSTVRIAQLQSQLRDLEDKLVGAQQRSEDIVASHEADVDQLQQANNTQLQRPSYGYLSPGHSMPSTPITPIFTMKSPRLDKTTSGNGMSFAEVSRTGYLEKKVKELELALADAELEMQEVVGRMNMAQIEVAELQSERLVFSLLNFPPT